MPISRLYGAAAPRFIREIKQSEHWDRAAIDTPPGPFETTGGFVWTGSGEPRVGMSMFPQFAGFALNR